MIASDCAPRAPCSSAENVAVSSVLGFDGARSEIATWPAGRRLALSCPIPAGSCQCGEMFLVWMIRSDALNARATLHRGRPTRFFRSGPGSRQSRRSARVSGTSRSSVAHCLRLLARTLLVGPSLAILGPSFGAHDTGLEKVLLFWFERKILPPASLLPRLHSQ